MVFLNKHLLSIGHLAENTFFCCFRASKYALPQKENDEQTTLLLKMLLFCIFFPFSVLVCSLASQNSIPI